MRRFDRPAVVFQPETTTGLLRGINLLSEAIAPTLGPLPRYVVVEHLEGVMPEQLDKAGNIARRVIELRELNANTGAMYLRGMLWDLQEKVGDGGATATVIFQSIIQNAAQYLAGGGNIVHLRYFLERQAIKLVQQLEQMACSVMGKEELTAIANAVCFDSEIAYHLGKIFDTVGKYGQVDIRGGYSRACSHDFVQGAYWPSKLFSRKVVEEKPNGRLIMDNVAILISDYILKKPIDLVPILNISSRSGAKYLLLIAGNIEEQTLVPLLAAQTPGDYRIIPVQTPGATPEEQYENMQDLALLTGGNLGLRVTTESMQNVTLADLGYARSAWVDRFHFGIVSGQGDPMQLRAHIAKLKAGYHRRDNCNKHEKKERFQERLGKFNGGSAILYTGGDTDFETKSRQDYARQAEKSLRLAHTDGYLPGGGTAYLSLKPLLARWAASSTNIDEQAGYRILSEALEAPFRTIVRNAGYSDHLALAAVTEAGAGKIFDVRTGQIVDCVEAGVLDPAGVIKEALLSAVKSAALLLTTDVLVHQSKPERVLSPS